MVQFIFFDGPSKDVVHTEDLRNYTEALERLAQLQESHMNPNLDFEVDSLFKYHARKF